MNLTKKVIRILNRLLDNEYKRMKIEDQFEHEIEIEGSESDGWQTKKVY